MSIRIKYDQEADKNNQSLNYFPRVIPVLFYYEELPQAQHKQKQDDRQRHTAIQWYGRQMYGSQQRKQDITVRFFCCDIHVWPDVMVV